MAKNAENPYVARVCGVSKKGKFMTGNRISRQKLNNELKKLPLPVQEHCKRCKLIALFLLERIKGEDWFYDAKLNADHIASAVFLHDVGKAAIPRDNLYAEHNVVKAKQVIYRSHVEEGVKLVENLCDIKFADFDARKFETYVYQAITEHHENADGCGFPHGLRAKNTSVTGKITAIADAIDNMFFVGATESKDVDENVKQLREMSGTVLDKDLLGVMLADLTAFTEFIRYIDARYRNKRKTDNYGLQLQFRPIRNIIENDNREFLAEFIINDPFYGIVKPEVYLPVANMSSQTSRLTLLMVERLCLMLDRVRERGGEIEPVTLAIEAECFATKKFVPELIKLLEKYSIRDDIICLVVDEKGLAELEDVDYVNAFALLRKGGYRMGLTSMSENSSLVTSLDTLEIDYLFVHPSYTHRLNLNAGAYGVASGVLEIAHNLHVSVVFLGCDTHATEKVLLKLRARLASGELYGAPVREHEMVSLLARGGDAL